jgi:hypothetical protein
MVILKKLINAVAPGAQPFRMTGRGFTGRGSGPRLTDRKYYNASITSKRGRTPVREGGEEWDLPR